MNYLKHIDGLRALAVISIILFHLDLKFFSGGFVGVDIFFVISGFLITGWLKKRIFKTPFHELLKVFYENRIKRLIPALFFFKIVVLIAGIFLMNSFQFNKVLEQNLYSLFFLSNVYLSNNSDYFSLSTFLNPLVHTWSLSVEEQFYIFFPLFFITITFFYKKKTTLIIFFLCFLSLVLAQSGGNLNLQYPFIEKELFFFSESIYTGYYLIFGRLWEFFLGALFFLKKNLIYKINFNNKKLISNTSFAIVVFSILLLDETFQYPSIWTLPVAISTGCLITTFSKKNKVLGFLISRPFVFTGLISYSLYLWHQPILAFCRISIVDFETNYLLIIFIIIVFYLISVLSYKYIELPLKTYKYKKNSLILIFFTTSLLFILISIFLKKEASYFTQNKLNYNNKTKNFSLDLENEKNLFRNTKLKIDSNNGKTIFLIGDSMATNWVRAINESKKNVYEFKHIVLDEICFRYLVDLEAVTAQCSKDVKKFLNTFANYEINDIQQIYILNNWNKKTIVNILYLAKFFSNNINKVTVVGSAKFVNLPLYFLKIEENSKRNLKEEAYNRRDKNNLILNETIIKISKKEGFNYINGYNFFCNQKECKVFDENKKLFFWDNDHLTHEGALFLSKKIDIAIYKKKYFD